jgi:hypothetical protein
MHSHLKNDFPICDFVLVATTPLRESFRCDDRAAFIRRCVRIADGRPILFKLHRSEYVDRAKREINRYAPGSIILTSGDVNHMIANASTVITQQSSCTFVAIVLGKEVYTNLELEELNRLMPIQNNGTSSQRIAGIAKRLLHTPMPVLQQIRRGHRARPSWEKADL